MLLAEQNFEVWVEDRLRSRQIVFLHSVSLPMSSLEAENRPVSSREPRFSHEVSGFMLDFGRFGLLRTSFICAQKS